MKTLRILFVILLFSSCDQSLVYNENKAVQGQWALAESVEFTLPEMDSIAPYHIFINLRNTEEYKFSNLFLIAAIHFPNGKVVTDTLEYEMARPDGRWLGQGGKLKENKLWYKENIRFFEPGNYTIALKHAMRSSGETAGEDPLEGVTDVGISIELAAE